MALRGVYLIGLTFIVGALAVGACSESADNGKRGDPGGNARYGADYIGYKNAKTASAAGEGDSAPAGSTGSTGTGGGSSTTGVGGGASLPGGAGMGGLGAGGSGGSGDIGGIGGGGEAGAPSAGGAAGEPATADFQTLSWTDPERGPAPAENPFFVAGEVSTSTFSIDADTGSYTLTRSTLANGELPPRDVVRIEEFLNYFHFHYAEPEPDVPLSLYTEIGACPWNPERDLVMIGVQGQELKLEDQPPLNLVFLMDVSGSMAAANKLPLLKSGFRMLARQLREQDRVSLVTYAGNEAVVLDGAKGSDHETIDVALANLEAGGSTNGEGGLQKAYELAAQYFIQGGTNRVLLGTDGDFNVGISDVEELKAFIAQKRDTGVFLLLSSTTREMRARPHADRRGARSARPRRS